MKTVFLKALVILVGCALGLGVIFGFTSYLGKRYSARANGVVEHEEERR